MTFTLLILNAIALFLSCGLLMLNHSKGKIKPMAIAGMGIMLNLSAVCLLLNKLATTY
ncbi:hypothetical protein J6TS7_29120 [Paenibacillus dendritiformis]|uniref:hypothetical protein n=1 Tax=Paenibacillus dendritiformis TaxID=130049 RepID=UPI001B29607F|nr:hypothetical protein [Paenibacillus dendritiformis]GIO79302.1 hypothetical protein J6TS7_29120 [Paenibacillus dendritiformis]